MACGCSPDSRKQYGGVFDWGAKSREAALELQKEKFKAYVDSNYLSMDFQVSASKAFRSWSFFVYDAKKKAHREKVAMKAMMALAGSQRWGVLECIFKAWERCVHSCQEQREIADMKVDLNAAQRKNEEAMKRVLIAMTKGQGQCDNIVSQSAFVAWYQHFMHQKEVLMHKQELMRKAMATWANDATVMTRNVFVCWFQHLDELRKERVHAQRLLMNLVASEKHVLMGVAFGSWFKFGKEERARIERYQKKEKNQKLMASFADGMNRFVLAQAFAAFVQNRIEQMQEKKMKVAGQKGEEVMRKFLQSMDGRNSSILKRNAFMAWAHQSKNAIMQQESMRKVLSVMTNGDDKVVTRNVFVAWNSHLAEIRNDRVRALKAEEEMRKIIGAMMNGDAKVVTFNTFTGWKQHLKDLRIEKVHESMMTSHKNLVQKREDEMRKVLAIMSKNDAKVVTQNVFVSWKMLMFNGRMTRACFLDRMTRTFMTFEKKAVRDLGRQVLAAWNQLVLELPRRLRIEVETTKSHEVKPPQTNGPFDVVVDEIFHAHDANHDGILEWNAGEIRAFMQVLFERQNWVTTSWQDRDYYALYRQHDVDCTYSLTLEECRRLAHDARQQLEKEVIHGANGDANRKVLNNLSIQYEDLVYPEVTSPSRRLQQQNTALSRMTSAPSLSTRGNEDLGRIFDPVRLLTTGSTLSSPDVQYGCDVPSNSYQMYKPGAINLPSSPSKGVTVTSPQSSASKGIQQVRFCDASQGG